MAKPKGTKPVSVGKELPSVPDGEGRRQHAIDIVLGRFLHAVDDYRDAVNMAVPLIATKVRKDREDTLKILKRFEASSLDVKKTGLKHFVADGPHDAREMLEAVKALDRLQKSRIVSATIRSLFIGVFSEYDGFIGSLLKAIYFSKPNLFKGIRREISLSELLDFENLNAVKVDMLEKEIDAFRRQSYIDQFAELERKFDIKALRSFAEWPEFVELSQRRNAMTHNSGLVGQQYLLVCEREGYKFDERPKINEELHLTPEYISRALLILTKVGFMLAHTLWRKLDPDSIDDAHDSLNNAIYDLLKQGRWNTSWELGQFGLSDPMTKGVQDIVKKIRIINSAIALKRSKRVDEAIKLLDGEDWTACIREFKLANEILRNNHDKAVEIMHEIGKTGELLRELDYHVWPLFEGFNELPQFQAAYEKIYSKSFVQQAAKGAEAVSKDASTAKPNNASGDVKPVTSTAKSNFAKMQNPKASASTKRRGRKAVDPKADS